MRAFIQQGASVQGGNRTPHIWGDSETWLLNYQVQTKQRAGSAAQQQGHRVGMHVKYPPESINAKVPYMHKQGAPFPPHFSQVKFLHATTATPLQLLQWSHVRAFPSIRMLSFKFNLFVIRRSCPLATPNCRLSVSASVPQVCRTASRPVSKRVLPRSMRCGGCHFEPWGTCCWCNSKLCLYFTL
jgi:hypothetical protein